MPYDPFAVGDPEDYAYKLASHAGGGRGVASGGGVGGGPPGGGGGFFGGSGGAGSSGYGHASSLLKRKKLLGGMSAATQSMQKNYADGGEVSGPVGMDAVPAMLTANEGVLTTSTMSMPGVPQMMDLLNAISALGMPPGMTPEGPDVEPDMDPAGEEPGDMMGGPMAEQPPGYFLGGLVDKIPVIGKPLHKAISVAAPIALAGLGIPLPVAVGLSNILWEGSADDPLGTVKRATQAGVENYVSGKNAESDVPKTRISRPMDPTLENLPRPEGYARGGRITPYSKSRVPKGPPPQGPPPSSIGGDFTRAGVGPSPAGPGDTTSNRLIGGALDQGMFDPGGNPMALSAAVAHLNRQGQARDRGDVNDLMAMGMGDPNLMASGLMRARQERAYSNDQALAGIAENSANRAEDFTKGLYQTQSKNQWDQYMAWLAQERAIQLKRAKGH